MAEAMILDLFGNAPSPEPRRSRMSPVDRAVKEALRGYASNAECEIDLAMIAVDVAIEDLRLTLVEFQTDENAGEIDLALETFDSEVTSILQRLRSELAF